MQQLIDLAIQAAAAKRLTRLITEDEITRPIREHPFTEKHPKLSYLLHCPHCVGIYTSAGVVLLGIVFPKTAKPILSALAIAEVQSSLTELEAQRSALVDDYGPPL